MRPFWILFSIVFLGSTSIHADYFRGFTQVDVQPELGRIAIHRGVARTAKYVDWMLENREPLWMSGIFPDASLGEILEVKRSVKMDDQNIEVVLNSNHESGRRGPGTALPDTRLKITIDGVVLYNASLGPVRGRGLDVTSASVFPADHLLCVSAIYTTFHPDYKEDTKKFCLFYDEQRRHKVIPGNNWLIDRFTERPEEPETRETPARIKTPSIEGTFEKVITINPSSYSQVYPAVLFFPSDGTYTAIPEGFDDNNAPGEFSTKGIIWVEPNDPEIAFMFGSGFFARIGTGREIFDDGWAITRPRRPSLEMHAWLANRGTKPPEPGSVFLVVAQDGMSVIMIEKFDRQTQTLVFRWKRVP